MLWVEERLRQWSDWARTHQLVDSQKHPLASLVQIAAGEVPGRDLDIPHDMLPEIEITDKAVAKLREQNRVYKRVIMRFWMGRLPILVLAQDLRCDDERARVMLQRAQLQVGRNILMLERALTPAPAGSKFGRVHVGEKPPT